MGVAPGARRTAEQLGLAHPQPRAMFVLNHVCKTEYSDDHSKKRSKNVLIWQPELWSKENPEINIEIECTAEPTCGEWIDARLPIEASKPKSGSCDED